MQNFISEIYLLLTTHFTAKAVLGGVFVAVSFIFDVLLGKVLLILLILTFADCLLGYIRALFDKKAIVSRLMRKYAWRFTGYTLTASTLFLVAEGMPKIYGVTFVVSHLDDIALAFFIVQEAISVIEHLNELGIPMPKNLFSNLRKIKDKLDDPIDQYKPSLKK